ncbi:hypothetical protein H2204_002444 [Knufia peltigerae]|uniref:Pyrroline-5-carboxylate reductase n=1 Tax=Knufia peltigerae TaxID=1002370 RepID=A0AA38YBH9_9EURO|nr:hypothetical protein H2204_002444 [Knufia peltigerae]
MSAHAPPKKLHVAILGCGEESQSASFMGSALLSGVLQSLKGQEQPEFTFTISAPSSSSLERLRRQFGAGQSGVDIIITADNVAAAREARVVILGFQPQQLAQVFEDANLVAEMHGKLIVSLLAGVSLLKLADKISPQQRITRVIPSIGAQVGESATLVASDTSLTSDEQELVFSLFKLIGSVQLVPESLLNTVTAISAATHALSIVAVDSIVDASVAEGVTRTTAQAVATQCLRSASTLLQGSMTIESFKESMSVPRGITINALLNLEKGQVRAGISDAVQYAVNYAKNM